MHLSCTQGFSPPFQQFPPISQQISTLQNPLQSSPQQLHPSLKLHSQPAPSYSQAQTYLPQVGPTGALQSPPIPTPFTKALPDQTPVGLGQQSTASSMTALQVPPSINMQSQGRPSLPNQPHQVFPQLQQFPQLPLQSPSPMAQMLTQQAQALQASFQSSQQAFSQIQQQLQMMQPPNQSVTPLQQSSQPLSQQVSLQSKFCSETELKIQSIRKSRFLFLFFF